MRNSMTVRSGVIAGGSGSGMSIAGIAVASFVSPYDVPSRGGQSATSGEVSCSAASCRILVEGVTWGLGGCAKALSWSCWPATMTSELPCAASNWTGLRLSRPTRSNLGSVP